MILMILLKNVTADGKESVITLDEFVDAKMRRTKEVVIDKNNNQVSFLVEGETTPEIVHYTETDTSMTFTWPDGFTSTVSIL